MYAMFDSLSVSSCIVHLQVSPSAGNRQLATDCSPSNPMLINDRSDRQW